MKTVFEQRASSILHNLILSNNFGKEYVYLVPANICPIVVFAIRGTGTEVEFIDIDASTLCMSHELALKRLGDGSKRNVAGIIYARTYGFMGNVSTFFKQVKSHCCDVQLIDDRCLVRPEPDSNKSDSMGADVVLYSTGYGKFVDMGFGGFAHLVESICYESHPDLFNNDDLLKISNLYKRHIHHGTQIEDREYVHKYDQWLDTSSPVIPWKKYSTAVLKERERVDQIKFSNNEIYREIIPLSACMNHNYHDWRFQVLVNDKAALINQIENAGLFASGHYYPSALLFSSIVYEQANMLHQKIVNLFNDRYVTQDQVKKTAAIVAEHIHNDICNI